ncbi:MAG: GIY-YIG nuclease family protein [Terriglobia bacterium]
MYYVYLIISERDGRFYTGCTNNLTARISDHNQGKVRSTTARKPFRLIYYEACVSKQDAFRREKYLKTGRGKRYLRNRLRTTLHTFWPSKLERP